MIKRQYRRQQAPARHSDDPVGLVRWDFWVVHRSGRRMFQPYRLPAGVQETVRKRALPTLLTGEAATLVL